MNQLSKKYGLLTAIAMVVGIVIGSGIFFKADDVLLKSNGNIYVGLAAWIIGAVGMIFGAQVFGIFAQRFEKSNGIVDYTEALLGEKAGYLAGWFIGVLYYFPLTAVLSWVSALYTSILVGSTNPVNSPFTWAMALLYLISIYVINIFSPVIAGKLQVSTMVIKLIPLTLIAVTGLIFGLSNGILMENLSVAASSFSSSSGSLATAVVACAFAYEGWIVAVSINEEIVNSKKNLPKALIFGTIIVFLVYVFYFLGINSILTPEDIMTSGDGAITLATEMISSPFIASLIGVFVIVSCLGTTNGLVLASSRTGYSLATRNCGPFAKQLAKVNDKTGMPINSALFSFAITLIYLGIWFGNFNQVFGQLFIDISELPIVLVYTLYATLYVTAMVKLSDLNLIRRFVIPTLAIAGSLVVVYGGLTNPNISYYMIISVGILLLGLPFYNAQEKKV